MMKKPVSGTKNYHGQKAASGLKKPCKGTRGLPNLETPTNGEETRMRVALNEVEQTENKLRENQE